MTKIYIAFYKHKRKVTGIKSFLIRLFDEFTRLVTSGPYSHCEIAVEKEDTHKLECFSSSFRDGGVRTKLINVRDNTHWDLLEVTDLTDKDKIEAFFKKTDACTYDIIGLFTTVINTPDNENKYFCSEWCATLLGIKNPAKYSPNKLYKLLNTKGYA